MCDMLFFFNDTATTEIYTLSLHDALPIWLDHLAGLHAFAPRDPVAVGRNPRRVPDDLRHLAFADRDRVVAQPDADLVDRKSTRLNSSHANISYAVFCLKKKTYVTLGSYQI